MSHNQLLTDGYLRDFKNWMSRRPTPVFVKGAGAFDEATPPPPRKSGLRLMKLLVTKLSEEDYLRLRQMLRGEAAEDAEGFASPHEREVSRMDDPRGASRALDEPPPFKGRPRPGGAMDEALRRDMSRVRVDRSARPAVTASTYGVKVDGDFLAKIGKLS